MTTLDVFPLFTVAAAAGVAVVAASAGAIISTYAGASVASALLLLYRYTVAYQITSSIIRY
jgi:hypothetical protein